MEPSGPGRPDKSQGLDDDLISLFAGGDFNLSDDDTMDNTSLLTNIDSALSSSSEKGPPVSPHLAKIIDQHLSCEIDREKLKCIVSKYKTPQNCEQLYLTKINQEIWSQLPAHAKRADIRVANLQDTLLGGISATLVSVNELLDCREKKTLPVYKGLITNFIDSVALTGLVCKELSYKRRETLRPLLNKEFQQACSRSNKIGKLLFGDDLPKTIQDIRSTNKVMNTVAKPMNTNRKSHSKPKPYSHASTSNDKSFFMGKGEDSASSQEIVPSKPITVQQKEIYQALENFKTQVNKEDYDKFVNVSLKAYLASRSKNFKAGQLSNCYEEWKQITSDEDILATISGGKIEFMSYPPIQHSTPCSNALQKDQLSLVEQEIRSLLEKEVIVNCEPEEIEFVSPILPKKDGKLQLILNLKKLNTSVKYANFKMDSIHTILKLITKDCWMASIDLRCILQC